MGFWKKMGIAALVVAGPISGGATIAVAAAAIAGGRAVRDNIKEGGRQEGFEQGKAENTAEVEELRDKLHLASDRFQNFKEFEDHTIALFAVALAVAHCDGEFSPEEKEEIDEFVAGSAQSGFPESWNAIIKQLYDTPPNFNTAMEYVKKSPRDKWEAFDEIITMVSAADGKLDNREQAFNSSWNQFKRSA